MPKRKEPEMTPEEQYKRFKEAAKEAGVTTDEKQFEEVFKKVASQKPTMCTLSCAQFRVRQVCPWAQPKGGNLPPFALDLLDLDHVGLGAPRSRWCIRTPREARLDRHAKSRTWRENPAISP